MRLIDSFELFTLDRFSVCKGIYCFLLLRSLSKFMDFVKVGVPMVLITYAVVAVLIPIFLPY